MKSQRITLSRRQATRLARKGGFTSDPSISASDQVRGAFGEALVRGWLVLKGYDIGDHALVLRAEDFGLDVFPSFRRRRLIEIATTDGRLAEVKTYGNHYVQGTVGDSLEEQLSDDLMWRKLSKDRTLALATVSYYGRPAFVKADLGFLRANRIPILKFIIEGMSGKN